MCYINAGTFVAAASVANHCHNALKASHVVALARGRGHGAEGPCEVVGDAAAGVHDDGPLGKGRVLIGRQEPVM